MRKPRSLVLGILWVVFIVTLLMWLLWSIAVVLAEIGVPGDFNNERNLSALIITFAVAPIGLLAAGTALKRRRVGLLGGIAMLLPVLAISWWTGGKPW